MLLAEPVEIKMTKHQIAMARLYVVYVLPLAKKSGWIILSVVLALSLLANEAMGGDSQSAGEVLITIFGLGGSWFLLNYTRERGNKEAARMYLEGFSLTLRDDGVLYQVGEAFEVLPWAKFAKVLKTKSWIYLYFDTQWALIIPRTAFASTAAFDRWEQAAAKKLAHPS